MVFGSYYGKDYPYMFYGINPKTGNVTATFPVDAYPHTDFLLGGSDSTVRRVWRILLFLLTTHLWQVRGGSIYDFAPWITDGEWGNLFGVYVWRISVGGDKFHATRIADIPIKSVEFSSISNPAAYCALWRAKDPDLSGIVDLKTGQVTITKTTIPFAFIGASRDPGQSPADAKFITSQVVMNGSTPTTCYGFFSTANLTEFKRSFCTNEMPGWYSLVVYSEDHAGFFFAFSTRFADREPRLWFLPMQWGLRSRPTMVPGVSVPNMPFWAISSNYDIVVTSERFV